ncbi:hypothetical protein BVC80_379g97 [Macleaya cordata]|uniref:Uncharacterized protein n=1 Tax=Macleaya cordata TaxID=56857 RepID=A0A200QSY5_MACCD|nr:hypothetical protein BVC80_379g97 [Macleaya cordata]
MLYSDGWNPDLKLDPPVYDLDYESDGSSSFDDDDERKWTWCEEEPHNGTEAVLPEGATITQQVDLPDQDVSEQPDADDDDWRGSGVQHSGEASQRCGNNSARNRSSQRCDNNSARSRSLFREKKTH